MQDSLSVIEVSRPLISEKLDSENSFRESEEPNVYFFFRAVFFAAFFLGAVFLGDVFFAAVFLGADFLGAAFFFTAGFRAVFLAVFFAVFFTAALAFFLEVLAVAVLPPAVAFFLLFEDFLLEPSLAVSSPKTLSQFFQNLGVVPVRTMGPLMVLFSCGIFVALIGAN
ncbi:hypothetical protein [Polystyrenella longa]|uniref:hypothetical protein n=1 Tax=Polystyrenella longa TaxID=2528007 RepID=UPI0018D24D0C|nr:hypothetical protein [Polystyrenella longa]